MILILILVLNGWLGFYFELISENTHQAKGVTIVYLVRHAEKSSPILLIKTLT
jgi:hypothetical protein